MSVDFIEYANCIECKDRVLKSERGQFCRVCNGTVYRLSGETQPGKPTEKPFPPELAELVDGLLVITADKQPDEVLIIAAAPYFWNGQRAGDTWVIVEGTWEEGGRVYANVRAITGKPFKFQGYQGKGQTTEGQFLASSLSHVMKVQNRDLLAYYGTAEALPKAAEVDDGYPDDWFEKIEPIEF